MKQTNLSDTVRDFDWGPFGDGRFRASPQICVEQEIFIDKIYESMFSVEHGDIVVDIGASVGPFAYSILPNGPSKVFCVEPSRDLLPFLMKNVGRHCVVINKGISHKDGELSDSKAFLLDPTTEASIDTITFQTFIESNKITTIDFLKTDCEGAEYDIFNAQNLEWIKNNVKKIAGEWHLSNPSLKEKFINFRDHCLPFFDSYQVFSIDGVNIKWDLPNRHFVEYYDEVMIHIDNRT